MADICVQPDRDEEAWDSVTSWPSLQSCTSLTCRNVQRWKSTEGRLSDGWKNGAAYWDLIGAFETAMKSFSIAKLKHPCCISAFRLMERLDESDLLVSLQSS